MKNNLSKLLDASVYFLSTMKNRYPCKILKIRHNKENSFSILFKAGGKFSTIEMEVSKLIEDSALIEKFHPFESMQLGFLSTYALLDLKSKDNPSEKIPENINKHYGQL